MNPKQITSVQNPKIKAAARLKRGRGRKTQGRIVIFGLREVTRAIASGLRIEELFLCSDLLCEESVESLLQAAQTTATPVFDMPVKVFAKLAYGERNDGVVATAFRPRCDLKRLSLPEQSLIVILEGIEKPGNLGAVLRSVDGAGAHAMILADPQCDPFHPNCIRASLGTVFSIPLASGSTRDVIEWCNAHRLSVFRTDVESGLTYSQCDYKNASAVVFGNEAAGLSAAWNHPEFQPIRIPMNGVADSLNISVAAGIVLYEALRQRSETR